MNTNVADWSGPPIAARQTDISMKNNPRLLVAVIAAVVALGASSFGF